MAAMRQENFDLVLNRFLGQKPFRPFTLELISGGRVEVNHPEALQVHRQRPARLPQHEPYPFGVRGGKRRSVPDRDWYDLSIAEERREKPAMMKPHLFQEAVDAFKKSQPFRPFVIELDTGERLVVERPEVYGGFAGAGTYDLPGGDFLFVDAEDVKQLVVLTPVPPG
jgi:hypothetical protein